MNAKKIKRLRKQLGYHPNQPREYEAGPKSKYSSLYTKELKSTDKRYIYQQLKKEKPNV